MIKLLHVELQDYCDNCPYLRDSDECSNLDTTHLHLDVKDGRVLIPDWCPLPTKEFKWFINTTGGQGSGPI